jgi:hypothetical protein
MNRHVVFRILMLLVLVGAVIGIGALAYNAGVMQGIAVGAQVSAGDSAQTPYPTYLLPYGRPWIGVGGFGCFGVLMVLFLLFLVFGAVRGLFWPRIWGGHHMHRGVWGPPPGGGQGDWARGVPSIFDEWHRRVHAAPDDETAKG